MLGDTCPHTRANTHTHCPPRTPTYGVTSKADGNCNDDDDDDDDDYDDGGDGDYDDS